MIRFLGLISVLACITLPAHADVLDDVQIRLAAEPQAVRPGEEFTLSIYTDMPWEIGVHIPRYFDSIGPFAIVEGYQAKAVPVADRRRSHASYRLQAPAETGSYEIGGMKAYVQLVRMQRPGDCERDSDQAFVTVQRAGSPFDECKEGIRLRFNRMMQGDRFETSSPPLVVIVYEHVPPGANSMEPRTIAPPVSFPAPVGPSAWVAGALGVAFTALVAAVVAVLRRRHRASGPPVPEPAAPEDPASEVARAALARLRAMLAREASPSPTAPIEIATVLRAYIDRRLGLPAPRRTTEETVSELSRLAQGTGLSAGFLARAAEETLAICDLVKFAGRAATPDDLKAALGAAERFVSASAESPA